VHHLQHSLLWLCVMRCSLIHFLGTWDLELFIHIQSFLHKQSSNK
jgi:hypothetical protein